MKYSSWKFGSYENFEAVTCIFRVLWSLWSLPCVFVALLPRRLPNVAFMQTISHQIFRFRDFASSYIQTSYRFVNKSLISSIDTAGILVNLIGAAYTCDLIYGILESIYRINASEGQMFFPTLALKIIYTSRTQLRFKLSPFQTNMIRIFIWILTHFFLI